MALKLQKQQKNDGQIIYLTRQHRRLVHPFLPATSDLNISLGWQDLEQLQGWQWAFMSSMFVSKRFII